MFETTKRAALIKLAKTAKKAEQIQFILSEDHSKNIQIAIAEARTFEGQKVLLNSPSLHAEALVTICQSPANFDFSSELVRRWFTEAIKRTALRPEQEVQIANTGKFVMQRALLFRSKLSGEALVAICQSPANFDFSMELVQQWFIETIERTSLTPEQEVQLANTGKFVMQSALLLRSKLSGEALVAICQSPANFDFSMELVQQWFIETIERTALTPEQEIQIANTGKFVMQRALLLRSKLSGEALVAICQSPANFNFSNETVEMWFENATRRQKYLAEEQKAALISTGIIGVLRGLK